MIRRTAGSAMRRGERAAGALPRARVRARVRAARLAVAILLVPALLGAAGASGETVPLSGDGPGERLDVTLSRVADPATPTSPADATDPTRPVPGGTGRLVSVEFRLENTGTAVYEDSPAAAAHLLDTYGHRYTGTGISTEAGPAFPDTVTLGPGGTAHGFVTFRLPEGAPLAAVQFALNGGLADDVGHWSLS
ncbi:hypothetical protein [Streptomyces sp. NPDC051183]|uniref:hypothetical protein n=1 Tax=Streptomyces sp. NPDC051183 TaxID=3155165 RepID=UPI0034303417